MYNLLLLAGFTLTGVAGYVMLMAWTGDRTAAVLAGSLLAFNAHTLTRFPHLQAIHVAALPLAVWMLDRVILGGRWRDALGLAACVVLAASTSGYLTVFTVCALAVAAVVRAPEWWGDRAGRFVRRVGAAAVGAVIVLIPLLWPYWRVAIEQGLARDLGDVRAYSASWWSYLATAGRLHYDLWSSDVLGHRTQDALFPGVAAVALSLVGVTVGGGWGGGRQRMLVAIGVLGLILSFGPATPVYGWAAAVFPPIAGLRGAARFGYLPLFAVAALAGFGLAALRSRLPLRPVAVRAVTIGLVVLAGIEACRAPIPYTAFTGIPRVYELIAADPVEGAVLELPLHPAPHTDFNAVYMLASTVHWRPLVNGYSGYEPASYERIRERVRTFPAASALLELRRLDVRYIVLHLEWYREPLRRALMEAIAVEPSLQLIAIEKEIRLYRLLEAADRAGRRP